MKRKKSAADAKLEKAIAEKNAASLAADQSAADSTAQTAAKTRMVEAERHLTEASANSEKALESLNELTHKGFVPERRLSIVKSGEMMDGNAMKPAGESMAATPAEMIVQSAAIQIKPLASQLRALRRRFDELGPYQSTRALQLLEARKNIARCAQRVYTAAGDIAALSDAAGRDSPDNHLTQSLFLEAREDYVYVAQRRTFDRAQLSLFVGPTLSLNGDDKFKAGIEVSALYDGGAGSFVNCGRVFTDFTYQTKGSVDVPKAGDAQTQNSASGNPFRKDQGYIRFNTGISTNLSNASDGRYSAFVSGGLTTIPGAGGSFPAALRPRYAVGVLTRTFLSDGLYSRLSLGIAHDEYWHQPIANSAGVSSYLNAYERGVVEALVLSPNVGFAGFELAGRLSLDTPLRGKGPSEVRLSVLALMDFNKFLSKIAKAGTTPAGE
ncbi:MAG: hypothetical protein NVS9B10_05480 [Nevskia sp.]